MAVAARLARTSSPVIVQMGRLLQRAPPGALSLAQGQVYWGPPEKALEQASKAMSEVKTSRYGPDEGMPELREALREKHGLGSEEHVMITQGANQAIMNALLCTTDASDAVGLLDSYYFNHHMCITQIGCRVHLIPRSPTMHPEPERIEKAITNGKLKALIITNPCNPTGTVVPAATLNAIADACRKRGCVLILDNTYRDFIYDGSIPRPERLHGPNIINVYSFSKNFGMSGWRMGYLTFHEKWSSPMLKVQDTIAICPTQIAQQAALGALEAGDAWIAERVASLKPSRDKVSEALREGGVTQICGGEGAIYLFAQLPRVENVKTRKQVAPKDLVVVERLILEHGIAVIPGSSCGAPGWIRTCFANLPEKECTEASERLAKGLKSVLASLGAPKEPTVSSSTVKNSSTVDLVE